MPYKRVGSKVYKILPDGKLRLVPGGDHKGDVAKAKKHLAALQINVEKGNGHRK